MTRAEKIARRIFQRIGTAIAVRVGNAVDVAGKRRESGFVGMGFAGERQGHHGAAVEGVFEGDDAGASGVGAGDLYCVLDRFSAAVYEQRFLGEVAGGDFVHSLGESDVVFVGRDLNAGVQEVFELGADGSDYGLATMSDV